MGKLLILFIIYLDLLEYMHSYQIFQSEELAVHYDLFDKQNDVKRFVKDRYN
jgi:hypothetical protein